jgi:hypothetical protein
VLPESPEYKGGFDVLKSEAAVYARFAQIGLGTRESFQIEEVSPETRKALEAGVRDGFAAMEEVVAKIITDPVSSAKVFGTREFLMQSARNLGLDKPWLLRMAGAHLGLRISVCASRSVWALWPRSRLSHLSNRRRWRTAECG